MNDCQLCNAELRYADEESPSTELRNEVLALSNRIGENRLCRPHRTNDGLAFVAALFKLRSVDGHCVHLTASEAGDIAECLAELLRHRGAAAHSARAA